MSIANDTGDNELIPRAVHKSPGIYLTAEEYSRKPQLGDSRWSLCNQTSPQMGSLPSKCDRHDRTARQEGRRKEWRKGIEIGCTMRYDEYIFYCKHKLLCTHVYALFSHWYGKFMKEINLVRLVLDELMREIKILNDYPNAKSQK